MRITEYKVVETQTVTDEELERIINRWVREGWLYDGVQFAMRESSKRPSMAFVTFTRPAEVPDEVEPAVTAEEADEGGGETVH